MKKKTRENVKFILVQQFCAGSIVLFFIFSRFNTMQLIILVKISLFGIASQLKVTNSGGLMLESKWAIVNDLVKIKFCSIIKSTEPAFTR